MILGGKIINNGYQAYLALAQSEQSNEDTNQKVIYVPQKKIDKEKPETLKQ